MKNLYSWVCGVERTVSMINLCVSTFLIFVSAIMRFIGMPLNWSLEISLFLFAWCVFLSADVGLREDRLVNLDLIVSRLPRKMRLWTGIFSNALVGLFLIAMGYYGFILSYTTRIRTFQGIPNFSYTWVTLSLPVAAVLMLITLTLKTRGLYRQLSQPGDEPQADEAAIRPPVA